MFVVNDGFIRGNLLLKKEHRGGKQTRKNTAENKTVIYEQQSNNICC